MIQASELRLGNKVLVNGKIVTVAGIDDQGINSSVSGGYYPGETEIEYEARFGGQSFWGSHPQPEPIPLTPEILLALGFTNDYEDHFEYPDESVDLGFTLKNEYLVPDQYYTGQAIGVSPQYLHTLQNLIFAVTDKELTYSPKK